MIIEAVTEASIPQNVNTESKKVEHTNEEHDHSHDGHDHSHGEEPHSHDSVNPNDPKHKDCKFHKAMGWFKRLFSRN